MGLRALSLFLVVALCDAAKRKGEKKQAQPDSWPSVVPLQLNNSNDTQEANQTQACTGVSILPKGLKAYEPSDLVWDPRENLLYSVSDNGILVSQTLSGELKRQWEVGKNYDLEGVTLVPEEADRVYLGRELPASIHRFDLKTGKIAKSWGIQAILEQVPLSKQKGKAKAHGIESLLYITASEPGRFRGYFLAGRQTDATIFVFGYTYFDTLSYRGWIQPPGPASDLSALTLSPDKSHVWLLFDGSKVLISMNKTDLLHPEFANRNMTRDMRQFTAYESWGLANTGLEGICHAQQDGESYIVLAVDKQREENIWKLSSALFQSCFLSH